MRPRQVMVRPYLKDSVNTGPSGLTLHHHGIPRGLHPGLNCSTSSRWRCGRSSGSASNSISLPISNVDADCSLYSDGEVLCHPWISGTASTRDAQHRR
jgi:hypothetical protein